MKKREVRKSEEKRSKYEKVYMMRQLEAVKDRCDVKEAVQSLNIPTSIPKRRVPENLLFSNTFSGPPNASYDEIQN